MRDNGLFHSNEFERLFANIDEVIATSKPVYDALRALQIQHQGKVCVVVTWCLYKLNVDFTVIFPPSLHISRPYLLRRY